MATMHGECGAFRETRKIAARLGIDCAQEDLFRLEEYEGLAKMEPDQQARRSWGNRLQHFRWVNDIEYRYGPNQRKKQIVHVVVCAESWEEIDAEGNVAT